MSNADFILAPEYPAYSLDIDPLISALRFQPTDFEFQHGWLHHVPSRHRFRFDQHGHVTIDAHCGCAGRPVEREKGTQLYTAFRGWNEFYWQPHEIDREFAEHFREPGGWVRLLRDVRMAWRRFRRHAKPITVPAEAMGIIPAE